MLARNSLAALLGAGPDRGATIAPPALHQLMPMALPRSLAAELVGRRPDIEAARLRTKAAGERIKVARAGFYPNVNLIAFIGVQSLGLGNLTAAGSGIGQASAAISLPIFDGGRLQGNYRVARADYNEAVAQYNATLVRAVREVADAAAGQHAVSIQLADAQAAVVASQEAFSVAQARYKGGLSNFLAVLSAQDALLRNRQVLIGGGYAVYARMTGGRYVSTDNAYVNAELAQITPQTGGPVARVAVVNTQVVRRGDVLVELDPSEARIALAQAEADLARATRGVRQTIATGSSLSAMVEARDADIRRMQARIGVASADLDRAAVAGAHCAGPRRAGQQTVANGPVDERRDRHQGALKWP